MNYRNTVLVATEAMAASGTKIIDLTLSDVISRITIDIYGVNTAVVPTAHPTKMISKVELVDGSDVLWGLSATEALALMYYQTRQTPFCINNYINDEWCRFVLDINFGRKLWDKQLAFDPKKFRNPQLKITYSRAAGGAAPDAGGFKVMADVFDQKEIAPIGFLSAKEIVSYTMAASANEYVDIPLDRLLKSLIIFQREGSDTPTDDIAGIKLSEDNDKRILWDDQSRQLQKTLANIYPTIKEHFVKTGSAAAETVYCMSSYEGQGSAVCREASAVLFVLGQPANGKASILGGTGASIHGIINGYAPFGSLILPFGDQQDIDDWYDVSKVGALELRITAESGASSSNTCEVVTEQLRKYVA